MRRHIAGLSGIEEGTRRQIRIFSGDDEDELAGVVNAYLATLGRAAKDARLSYVASVDGNANPPSVVLIVVVDHWALAAEDAGAPPTEALVKGPAS